MKRLLTVTFLLFTFSLFAQKTGVISGKVLDKHDYLSLPGATIQLDFENRYTISDQNGHYEFLDVPEGLYKITVQYIGFSPLAQSVKVSKGRNSVLNFALQSGEVQLNEVVIIGDYLKGQAKALNQQRNNENITNIISSDQVGRFPDANIGDALKRVSGVTMQNDQGEARNIIIRGMNPSLNSVSLNGDRVPSAEGDNRNVQMDLIPAEMISSIEVNKTLTPDMDADAIGGSVNLVTRNSPNRERISATISGGYMPIREQGIYAGSFLYGNRYLEDKLGIALSISYQNKKYGSDNVEAKWKKGKKGQIFSPKMDIRKYDVQRIRRSASVSFDYKFNENNNLKAKAIYNWRDDRENRFRTRFQKIKPNYDSNDNIIGYTGNIRRETKGGIDNDRNQNRRLEDQRVFNTSLKGEHLLSPKVDFDWKVSFSKAKEERPNERYLDYEVKGVSISEDLSDTRFPLITSDAQAKDFSQRKLSEQRKFTYETETGLKANIRFPFSIVNKQKGRIRTGIRFRLKNKVRDNIFYAYKSAVPMKNLQEIPTIFQNFKNWKDSNNKYVPGYFPSKQFLGGLSLNDGHLFTKKEDPSEFLTQNYTAKENISAAYLRWDQNLSKRTKIIIGLRVENTDLKYEGNYVQDEEKLSGKIKNTNNYTNWLPSLNFKHEFSRDFVVRAAATTSLARPNYYDLTPFVNTISGDSEVNAGNPNLKATYAYNFDVMAERYFKSVGMISAGFFYKNLKNFIFNYTDNNFTNQAFSSMFPSLSNPIPEGDKWKFEQRKNGDDVNVYGFELALQRNLDFLPGRFLKGFTIYTNYTYTQSQANGITNDDGKERKDLGLPGTAPHMMNASLSWENDRFSARVSLNYASDYLDEVGATAFEDVYYDQQTFLDINATYKITPKIRVFLEANNLTNQPLRYYQGTQELTYQAEYYKPTYVMGLKFNF